MRLFQGVLILSLMISASGCAVLEATGEAVGVVGKAAWAGTKAVGGIVYTGASMGGQTANQTNKTLIRNSSGVAVSTTSMSRDRVVVPLEREGKSFFVRLKLNNKVSARFLLDTGASAVQISRAMATKLKLKAEKARTVPVMLAGGGYVRGRVVDISEVAIGEAKVRNVKAIVLDQDNLSVGDGLLGMSFLENFVFSMDTKKGELILERRK
ncbi:MAG: clan AA aspartic protease [Candidatus Omnitrophica bacterium]|nr:clan AA aspartic protease [Candidatus Omnitrophota bacterium]